MSQVLTISDDLHARLQRAARERGLNNIEELLEAWQADEAEREARRQVVEQIDQLRERMGVVYGVMPDSVNLIHEDRQRP